MKGDKSKDTLAVDRMMEVHQQYRGLGQVEAYADAWSAMGAVAREYAGRAATATNVGEHNAFRDAAQGVEAARNALVLLALRRCGEKAKIELVARGFDGEWPDGT